MGLSRTAKYLLSEKRKLLLYHSGDNRLNNKSMIIYEKPVSAGENI
jgi:hypothetical protein